MEKIMKVQPGSERIGQTLSKCPCDAFDELGLMNSFVVAQESMITNLETKKKLLEEQIAALRMQIDE